LDFRVLVARHFAPFLREKRKTENGQTVRQSSSKRDRELADVAFNVVFR
jgi:hypothetical protein